jgi:NAD(P)-dependent dehydrogenase (short-subunit alcohol dehydrogenase family)
MQNDESNSEQDNLFRLDGRVIILTGGGGMLGREYTRTLVAAGARVAVADINRAAAEQSAASADNRGAAIGIGVDVSREDEVRRMVEAVLDKWGAIDVLVNNAALDPKFDLSVQDRQSFRFEEYPLALWQRSLDVNLTGAFLCAKHVGPVMCRQQRGVIVNVASTYGLVGPDQRIYRKQGEKEQTRFKPADYAVTKAGLVQLTRYLAAYWGSANIRVNTLTPGGVYNAQDEQFVVQYASRTPLGRMAKRGEMSGAMLFLVSDASSYMTGANLVVDGGWTAW